MITQADERDGSKPTDCANQRIFEFRNCPARFREWDQSTRSHNEARDDAVLDRLCTAARRTAVDASRDERADRDQGGRNREQPDRLRAGL